MLSDEVRKLLEEEQKQSIGDVRVAKLPCGCSIEIKKPGDQVIYCPQHKKKFFMTWKFGSDSQVVK